jgi:aspartyl/asparaginyl beta-hydroxylase (cupin superfamily)
MPLAAAAATSARCRPIKGAMFATLGPGARLVQHRDPYAGLLRYHLGLVTPTHPGVCRIFVDGNEYSWLYYTIKYLLFGLIVGGILATALA